MVYHPWKKEADGNQTREILYTISLSNPLAPKTATVTETQVGPTPASQTHPLSRGSDDELNRVSPSSIRLCTKPARKVSVTSSTPRSSRTTCPTTTTSTPSTATCSPGWPRTSVGYGEEDAHGPPARPRITFSNLLSTSSLMTSMSESVHEYVSVGLSGYRRSCATGSSRGGWSKAS